MNMNIDIQAARDAVRDTLCSRYGYAPTEAAAAVSIAIDTDLAYIDSLGEEEYDEDQSFENIKKALKGKVADPAAFADDFAEAWESYLNLVGAIEWDG